jgi:uncharacterized protein YndB with AHSA1/START domain
MRFIIALIIVLAIAIPSFIGFGANLSKSYTVSADAVYDRPVEMVWQVMTDYAAMPHWSKHIKKTEKLADIDGKPVWHIEFDDGHYMNLHIQETIQHQHHKTAIIKSDLPYMGTLLTEITQINDTKTAVKITEEVGMKGILSRLFMHYFQDQDDLIRGILQDTGEELARRPQTKPAATISSPNITTAPSTIKAATPAAAAASTAPTTSPSISPTPTATSTNISPAAAPSSATQSETKAPQP